MENIINIDIARKLAEQSIVSAVNFPKYITFDNVSLDSFVIIKKRFWVFFWDHTNIPIEDYWVLRDGFACFVNDRGETRLKHDIRNTPDEIDECISGMTKWAERTE